MKIRMWIRIRIRIESV